MGQIVVFEMGGGSFRAQISGEGWSSIPTTFGVRKLPALSRGVVCVILRLAVLIQYRRVTDKQTDRHTHTHTDSIQTERKRITCGKK